MIIYICDKISAADGTPRRNAIIAMPPMLPVLTGDPKKRDELAEKIKSCERELEWSNDGYIIEIDSAGVSLRRDLPYTRDGGVSGFSRSLLVAVVYMEIHGGHRKGRDRDGSSQRRVRACYARDCGKSFTPH